MFANEYHRAEIIQARFRQFATTDFPEALAEEKLFTTTIRNTMQRLNFEERLLMAFCISLFHVASTGEELYKQLGGLQAYGRTTTEILEVVQRVIHWLPPNAVDNHRQIYHLLARRQNQQASQIVTEQLLSYIELTKNASNQACFLGLKSTSFGSLMTTIGSVKRYQTRISMFDYAEVLTKGLNLNLIPHELYLDGSSGPMRGLILLFTGISSLAREKPQSYKTILEGTTGPWIREVLPERLLEEYNADSDIVIMLEKWLCESVSKMTKLELRLDAEGMFSIESALCNIQKNPRAYDYCL